MKQLLYIPVNSYLFWGKINNMILNRCISQYGRNFNAIAAIQRSRQEILNNPILDSKNQENMYVGKRFSSNLPKRCILMDFDVWLHPKFFRTLRNLYYFFVVLKEMDKSFSIAEFSRNTAIALQVVSTLLSELRFSELEGLLTRECKEEVEKNLSYWSKDQISVLAIKPEHIMKSAPCDVLVFSDDNNKEKMFAEIRVIHYVWLKYSSKFENTDAQDILFGTELLNQFQHRNLSNLYMCGVFNSKYIREFTKGETDQWTISAINVKCCTGLITTL